MKKVKTVKTVKKKSKKQVKQTKGIDPLIVMGVLAVITMVVFSPSLSNDFVNWDDPSYVLNNSRIQNFSIMNLLRMFNPFPSAYLVSNYHPLTELSLALDHMVYGVKPFGFHLTNMIIHTINTLLVFTLVTRLLKGFQIAAIITALFFAIHPMHVESVVWASERKDVLHVFFYLLALLQYIKYLDSGRIKKYLWITLGLFVCSLLSKAQAVTLPIVLLLLDYFYNRENSQSFVIEKIPFLALSLAFGILAIYAQKSTQADSLVSISLAQRPFTGSMSLVIYLQKLILPTGLCALHPYAFKPGEAMPTYFYGAIVAFFGYLFLLYKTFVTNRKVLFLGLAFFLITILPVLQFLTIGEAQWAERYSYLPYIGLFLIIGYYANLVLSKERFWQRDGSNEEQAPARDLSKFKIPVMAVLAVGLVGSAYLSWDRIDYWKNSPTLWEDVLSKYPGEKLAYVNLSHFYSEVKEWDKSQAYAEEGLKYSPNHYKLLVNKAFCMMKKKQHRQAVAVLEDAVKRDGEHYEIHFNLGICYDNLKEYDKALASYKKTLEYEPGHIQAFLQRGVIYSNQKNDQKAAIADFERVVEYAPTHLDALINMAIAHYKIGQTDGAISTIDKALKIGSKNPKVWYISALANAQKKNYQKALSDGRQAKALGQTGLEANLQQWEQALK